jgi:hypothetical protein
VVDPAADALLDALGGDPSAIERAGAAAPERVADVATSLAPLVLTRRSVTRVLTDLRDGLIVPELAQRWASFMRRGYFPRADASGMRPIDIDYEDESAIVEPLSRLDELGDAIDGTMSVAELNDWIVRLST